jgi:drug/metabolite transporter (DMT)-like permease
VSWLAAGLALLAAALLAVATVAQQRVAAAVPDDAARGLGLLRVLVRRRMWWYGLLGDGGGYVAQAAALGFGSVLLVQPLLVTTLLFALPLAARWAGRRPARAELAWAGALAVSLAVFVVVGNPTDGVDRAPAAAWLPLGWVLAVLFAAALLAAARTRGTARAVLLAAATALCYGAAAALTKGVIGEFDAGAVAVLTSWELYALVAVSVAGTLLQQSAFQAGGLGASLPTMTVGEPVVAVLIGTTVLGEQLRADGVEWALIGLLVVVMVVATVALARAAAPAGPPGQAAGRDGDPTPPTARGTSSSPTPGSARKPSAPA